MNREKEYIFLDKNGRTALYEIIDENIFLDVCHSGSLHDWDENYWCMIEQIYLGGVEE